MLKNIKRPHFVGIGGMGMSAIAQVLKHMGMDVSGSDASHSLMADKLADIGIKVYIGHAAGQLADCDALIVSSAIKEDNLEVAEARRRHIPVLHRSDALAWLLNDRRGVAVAGAHGKTTTTSMLSVMAINAGIDPTALIGGEVAALGGNACYGQGEFVIAEADESDGSFLKLFPYIAVITNIENDHLDYYKNMDRIKAAFEQFIAQTAHDGAVVLCFDDPLLRGMAPADGRRTVSYAIDEKADYQARNIRYGREFTEYELYYQEKFLYNIKLRVPGRHNVLNSLAATAAARIMAIGDDCLREALAGFDGAKRRFEQKGECSGIIVVDDYAHHPSEIKSTLAAAAQRKRNRLIGVFQPHRYTRTQLLKEEFGQAFGLCDIIILTDIYAASEPPLPGVDGRTLLAEVQKNGRADAVYIPDIKTVADYLKQMAAAGDLIITLGAGDIYKAGEMLLKGLAAEEAGRRGG